MTVTPSTASLGTEKWFLRTLVAKSISIAAFSLLYPLAATGAHELWDLAPLSVHCAFRRGGSKATHAKDTSFHVSLVDFLKWLSSWILEVIYLWERKKNNKKEEARPMFFIQKLCEQSTSIKKDSIYGPKQAHPSLQQKGFSATKIFMMQPQMSQRGLFQRHPLKWEEILERN